MYIVLFEIEYRPHAVKLFDYLDEMYYEVERTGNTVRVLHNEEEKAKSILRIGSYFLDQLEATFEAWDTYLDGEDDFESIEYIEPEFNYGNL